MKSSLRAYGLILILAHSARAADVFISLTGRSGESQQILALPPFIAQKTSNEDEALLAHKLKEVVRADLMFSRYFKILEQGTFFTGSNHALLAKDWKASGASWLLTAVVALNGPQAVMTVRLVNLASGEALFERYYRQNTVHWRSLAHKIADDLILAVTGKQGISSTRIAFASLADGHKEIFLVDYDGAGLRQLSRDRSISLLPRFAPDGKSLVFTSYKDGNPDLHEIRIEDGARRALSREQGLNIAGGYSPDGQSLLMTLSMQKDPNIYVKNLADGTLTRLTRHFGVDSSPTFSPDATQVAFISDRSGNPQVYLLNVTTEKSRRLTNAMNWCDSPSWSPTGEWVAFAGRLSRFDPIDIFLVDVTGAQVRQLTHGEGSNENPSWSPDGRTIAFTSTRNKKSELFVMDADGSAPHRIVEVPGPVYTPTWSGAPAR